MSKVPPLVMPEYPAPKAYFISPRYRVKVYCGDMIVREYEWISATNEEHAIRFVRESGGWAPTVRFEATLIPNEVSE